MQLIQPTTWATTDPTALQAVLDNVTDLLNMFGVAGGCMQLRWSPDDCAIQVSTDNGATWTAIEGWDLTSVQGCVMGGLSIRIDAGGNLQWSIDGGSTWTNADGWVPGTPPNPAGNSTDQQACNIATHLAQNIIQGALVSAINSFNTSIEEAAAASAIVALIPVFGPEVALTIDAAAGLVYLIYTTGSIGDYTAASTDPFLAFALQCAIYNTIKTDGLVTAANYAAVRTAITAIAYSPSDVQTAIDDFLDALDINGLLAAQQMGGLVTGTCAGCGTSPVAQFDGNTDYLKGTGRLLPYTDASAWTLCFWAQAFSTAADSQGTIFAEGDAGATQPTMQVYFQHSGSPGHTWQQSWYGASPTFAWRYDHPNGGTTEDNWHHIAIQHTSGNTYSWYIDGVNVAATSTTSTPSIRINDGNTYVGVNDNTGGFNEHFQGKLADMRIYGSALTSTQIADIHLAGVTGYLPVGAPLHWWKMDEGTGTTAADSGSSPATLTWHGSGSHWGTV